MPLTPLSLLAASDPLDHVLRHDLFHLGPIAVSNQMVMAVVAALLMLLMFPMLFNRAHSGPPSGARNFFESIMEFLRVEVFRPALKEHTDRFVPFLWTLFFFILFSNLLGQIPVGEIITLVTRKPSHWGGTATGTLTTTGTLAICAFLFIHFSGILQVARSLIDGTYGHHGHHEEHSADGVKRGHEAAHDLEHVRGEALAADVPADFTAVGHPTRHYEDDEHVGPHTHDGIRQGDGYVDHGHHGHGMNPVAASVLAVPLYFWNFAPHPFKPGPGQSVLLWVPDVAMWAFLLLLELIGAVITAPRGQEWLGDRAGTTTDGRRLRQPRKSATQFAGTSRQ